MKHFITAFLLLFVTQGLSAQKHYVRHNATGMNNGATWYDAFTSLHAALQQAQYGDTIWVAAGTYYPSDTTSRDATFLLPNGVRLFGGFSGIENLLAERDIQLYPAILSGDIGLPGDASDNCYNVLTCHDADSTTVLDGFIIQDGNANGTGSDPLHRKRGAAMYFKPVITGHIVSPQLRHCIFRLNKAALSGNALFAEGNSFAPATPSIKYCRFEQNTGGTAGQTVYYAANAPNAKQSIQLDHNYWGNNQGSMNVLIYHTNGYLSAMVTHDTFSGQANTGPIRVVGLSQADSSDVRVLNSVFSGHSDADLYFTADYFSIGKHYLTIKDCLFTDNGPIDFTFEIFDVTLDNNKFINNQKISLIASWSAWIMQHNIFQNSDQLFLEATGLNRLSYNVFSNIRSLYLLGGTSASSSGTQKFRTLTHNLFHNIGLNCSTRTVAFNYCTFDKVKSPYDAISIFHANDTLIFNSCIFSGYQSTPPLIDTLTGPGQWARAVNCVFETPCEGVLYDADTLVCNGSNVFGVAPIFRDTAGGDFRLLPCSPGINMGDTAVLAAAGISTDIGGAPRVANGLPDAGAFETLLAIRRDTLVHASCDGVANGRVVYGVEACPPFEYQWINDSGMSGTQVDHLAGGQYIVTVTGQQGLILTDTFTIESTPVDLLLDAALTPASSAVSSDGAIVVEAVSGGTGPYQYAWSTGGTEYYIELAPAGAYSLTVTDINGCTGVFTFDLMVSGVTLLPQEELQVQPNPVRAGGRLIVEGEIPHHLQLYDVSGRSVAQEYGRSLTIPTALPAGMYLLTVQDTHSGAVRKGLVVVQ